MQFFRLLFTYYFVMNNGLSEKKLIKHLETN